tara:strand:+ start:836 stop:997 length:162 start_codon:yes stop_codon:yes gene_type:complete
MINFLGVGYRPLVKVFPSSYISKKRDLSSLLVIFDFEMKLPGRKSGRPFPDDA